MITTEIRTTEAREALALPKNFAALRGLCGAELCGKTDFAGGYPENGNAPRLEEEWTDSSELQKSWCSRN